MNTPEIPAETQADPLRAPVKLRMNAAGWARELGVNRSTVSTWLNQTFDNVDNREWTLWEILWAMTERGDVYGTPLSRWLHHGKPKE